MFEFEKLIVLLHEGVSGLGQDLHEALLVKLVQGRYYGEPSHEFRYHAVLHDVLGFDPVDEFRKRLLVQLAQGFGRKTERLFPYPLAYHVFNAYERAAADEKDVRRVHLYELLLRVFSAAFGGDIGYRALHQLKERLLNALARHVPRYGRAVALPGDLVYLVYIDYAFLALLDVIFCVLQKAEYDVFDVLADVTGLGQRGRVRYRKGHVQYLRESLGKKRLAASGRAEKQNIALLYVYASEREPALYSLVMVIDGDRKNLLGVGLAYDVVVERLFYLRGFRGQAGLLRYVVPLVLLGYDVVTQADALVANIDHGAGDEFSDLVLPFAAKRAGKIALPPLFIVIVSASGHN